MSEIQPEQHSRYEQIPQAPTGRGQQRFPELSALHSTDTCSLGLSQLCRISFSQRGSTRAHVALGALGFHSIGCSLGRAGNADAHLVWFQGTGGVWSSKEILVETPTLSALERYRHSPPTLSGSPLPPTSSLRVYFKAFS